MKIQFISDMHLEGTVDTLSLAQKYLPADGSDVLVLAGDILVFSYAWEQDPIFDWASENFKYTLYIPGNHEYYRYYTLEYKKTNEKIRDNVWLINNDYMDIDNVRFICSTLWSQILPEYHYIVWNGMMDYKRIKEHTDDYDGLLRVPTVNEINKQSTEFIFNSLSDKLHNIVATHHTPSYACTPEEFIGQPLNCAFNNNLDNRICDSNIYAWIYGHTHGKLDDIDMNGTWVTSNQLGYSGEREGFSKKNIII